MRLFLVRHGEAHAGFHGVVAGPVGCTGLTPHGRQQAEALRAHLDRTDRIRADVLVSSILPRAIETAEIIAPGLGIEAFDRHCDLCELHTGEADGLAWTEYGTRYGSFDMETEPERVFAPQGESLTSFHQRVHRMLERLAKDHTDQTVVAVCHAGVIMASLRVLLGVARPGTGARIQPTNTGLTEWAYDRARGRWTLHGFNDTAHLSGQTG